MQRLFLVIVTGLSGAGKSTVLSRLEDNGYYCVDNLPDMLLPEFTRQCLNAEPKILKAAVVIDARGSALSSPGHFELPDKLDADCKILFLDCDDETLLRRYIETRRRHPFAKGGDISSGIAYERSLLQSIRERAHAVIDTSSVKPYMLYKLLDDELLLDSHSQIDILITSFGYKRGIPIDADIVLDTRFFPNPFYEPALRPLSGLDEPVRSYVLSNELADDFFDAASCMLLHILPGFLAQGKQRVMIAFGCTGGRHRSVVSAEEIRRRLESRFKLRVVHRDLNREANDIKQRFEA